MAATTRPLIAEPAAALGSVVRQWERRLRLTQTARWLPAAVIIGGGGGIAAAIAARLRPLWTLETAAVIAIGLVALAVIGLLALVWLPRRSLVQSARRFDLRFGLNERISTAVELLDGRISAPPAIVSAQIEDAKFAARAARAADHLPLQHDRRLWLGALVTLIALVTLLVLPNPQADAAAVAAAENAAIDAARDTLQQITEDIAAETGLTDEAREALLETLEVNRAALDQPNVTPEEAFAAVTEVQSALQDASDLFGQRLLEAAQAAQQANNTLTGGQGSGDPALSGEQLQQTLAALQAQMEQIAAAEAERQALIQQLQAAADALEATNPAAAEALREAAEALQNNDPFAAQEALERAQDALEQAAEQSQSQQGTQGALDQAAQRANEAARSVSDSQAQSPNGEAQTQDTPSQDGAENQGDSAQQQAQDQGQSAQQGAAPQDQAQQGGTQGQQGAEGEQSQQGSASAPGDQSAAQQAGGGEGQSAQSAQGGQAQDGNPNAGDLNTGMLGSALAQAGDQSGGAGADQPSGARSGDQAPGANNTPDGTGESGYEQVYAPRRIGAAPGGDNLFLQPDASDAPVVEGNFSANAAGQSVVPYNQVFTQYQQAANAALNTGRIPLPLRDIIRGYFSSLAPR